MTAEKQTTQTKRQNLKEAGLTGHNRQRRKKEYQQAEQLRKIMPWFTIIKK